VNFAEEKIIITYWYSLQDYAVSTFDSHN